MIRNDQERLELRYSEEGNIVVIEAKQANEVHKTCGFHKSPGMSMMKQLK